MEHPAPLLGLVFWPVTGRFGAIVAYNLAETLALASSAWVAYLAFGRYLRTTLAAALGGLLFGFSPYMISHSLGHPPLTFVFTVPLMLLVFDDVLVRQLRPAPIAGGLLAHIVRLFAKEGRAGRFHFLHPIAPDRSASLYPDLAA